MGNSQTAGEERKDLVHTHERLKNSNKVQKDDKTFLEAFFPIVNERQYDEWKKKLQRDPCLGAENAFLPVDTSVSSDGICGKNYIAKGTYPNYFYVLSDELVNRKKLDNQTGEQQLWYLLYQLNLLASEYHKADKPVGDIRPDNIFFNKNGDIKVVTQDSWPREQTNYKKSLNLDEKTYLSPQDTQQVELGKLSPGTSFQSSQAFSIGLSALDMALLENSEQLYRKKGALDENKLNEKKNRLLASNGYSNMLKSTILNLLQMNPSDRLKPKQFQKWLQPNKVEILNMHPFEDQETPNQIKRTALKNGMKASNPHEKELIGFNNTVVNQEVKNPGNLQSHPPAKLESAPPSTYPVKQITQSRQSIHQYPAQIVTQPPIQTNYSTFQPRYSSTENRMPSLQREKAKTTYISPENIQNPSQIIRREQPPIIQQRYNPESHLPRTQQRISVSPPAFIPPPQINSRPISHSPEVRIPEVKRNDINTRSTLPHTSTTLNLEKAQQQNISEGSKKNPYTSYTPYTPSPYLPFSEGSNLKPNPSSTSITNSYTFEKGKPPSNGQTIPEYKPTYTVDKQTNFEYKPTYNRQTISQKEIRSKYSDYKPTTYGTDNSSKFTKPVIPEADIEYSEKTTPIKANYNEEKKFSYDKPIMKETMSHQYAHSNPSNIRPPPVIRETEDIQESEYSGEEYRMDFLPSQPRAKLIDLVVRGEMEQDDDGYQEPIVGGGRNSNTAYTPHTQHHSYQPQAPDYVTKKSGKHITQSRKKKKSPNKNLQRQQSIERRMNEQVTQIIHHPVL